MSDGVKRFTVGLDELGFLGRDLHRPECLLATANGDVYAADWRGGVMQIRADGSQVLHGGTQGDGAGPVLPNGIALEPSGSFLMASLGSEAGVWRLTRDGVLRPVLQAVDGRDLPPTNFVMTDRQGRIWVTVSTWLSPREQAYRMDWADGFIVLIDGKGARIVADGIGYTNECQIDPTGQWLYVNETFNRKLTRFRLGADGSLSGRELVTDFGHGVFPDGLALDEEGGVWITSVVSNRVIHVGLDGSQHVVLEDSDPAFVDRIDRAFVEKRLTQDDLKTVESRRIRNLASLSFGGPDRRTAYLGSLLGDTIPFFRAPVAGLPLAHWAHAG